MLKLYDKTDILKPLHILFRKSEIVETRTDISREDEYLQVSAYSPSKGTAYRPHIHLPITRTTEITQECWIVISGSVKVTYYDKNKNIIHTDTLGPGDCTITFRGGHTYEILEDDTVVYEIKTGPYFGQTVDKEFI